MAKIYGVELKAVKRFVGHEGYCYQGNVYKDGKKVGFWSQDSRGGCDEYEFDTSILNDVINKMKKSLYYQRRFIEPEHRKTNIPIEQLYEFLDEDTLMNDLLNLREDESIYKKNAKQGYPITVIITDGYHIYMVAFSEKASEDYIAEEIKKIKAAEIKKGTFFKNAHIETKVYRSFDDFVISE